MVKSEFEDILTVRGLVLLERLGNGCPSLSQIELTQSIISLLSENPEQSKKLDVLLNTHIQSRESLQRDFEYHRFINDKKKFSPPEIFLNEERNF